MLICAPSFYFFTKVVLFLSLQKARHYSRSYIRGTGMHYAYVSYHLSTFPSLIPLSLFIYFWKTRVWKLLRAKPTPMCCVGHRLTRKRSPGYFSTLPRVTSKKFRPVKKETGMRSYLDTGLVNIRHVAKGNRASRAYTHVRRGSTRCDC